MAKRGPASTLHFTVTGTGGVPATGVTAVVLNVTATEPTTASFLTVYPDDVSRPVASNLNVVPGQTVPNLVVVRVPASGVIDFYNNAGSTHLLADVVGYYDGDKTTDAGRLIAGSPLRLVDTRLQSPFPAPGKIPGGGSLLVDFSTSPNLAAIGAFVLNVTVTEPTAPGHLIVYPGPPPRRRDVEPQLRPRPHGRERRRRCGSDRTTRSASSTRRARPISWSTSSGSSRTRPTSVQRAQRSIRATSSATLRAG